MNEFTPTGNWRKVRNLLRKGNTLYVAKTNIYAPNGKMEDIVAITKDSSPDFRGTENDNRHMGLIHICPILAKAYSNSTVTFIAFQSSLH